MALHAAAVAALLALSPWLTSPAVAQTIELDTAPAVRCLMPAEAQRGEPKYPFDAWKLGEKGRVVVDLAFAAADQPQVVSVIESAGGKQFEQSVRAHVAAFRVPCLGESTGGTVTLRQVYEFQPDQRKVYWSDPTDTDDEAKRAKLACMGHQSGAKSPPYPEAALRRGIKGRVHARLQFYAPDQPPRIQVHSRWNASLLAADVKQWAEGMRMPCFTGPGPIDVNAVYVFRFDGEGLYGLKPVSLAALLPFFEETKRTSELPFDTTQMGCPFDLRFVYLQPHMPNGVGELGDTRIERRPLLAWLAAQPLKMSKLALDNIYGDSTTVTVPCVKPNTQHTENKP